MYDSSQPKLKTIRASAGSGKTFNLIREYLLLLFANNTLYFRHILAVTFTNKATSEMKSRILKELDILARGDKSDHLELLVSAFNLDETQVQKKAHQILHCILHSYTWFKIDTIDSFFQNIIRAFSRELGIWGGYNLELDLQKVQTEAVDRMIDTITEDGKVIHWIIDFIGEQIGEGKSWNFKTKLMDISWQIQNEYVQLNKSLLEESLKEIVSFTKKINTEYYQSLNQLKALGQKGMAAIESNGLTIDDFTRKTSGPASFFSRVAQFGPLKDFNKTYLEAMEMSEKWATKTSKKRDEIMQLAERELMPLLHDIYKQDEELHTLQAIKQNLFALGLVSQIQKEVEQLCGEKNLFLINHTNPFLFKIIDNNDTPFIYEKSGMFLNHIFIDEFQDTSGLQWNNFKPLVSNSLSMGNDCLLVGDVKQSIYRWRNSNWEILGQQLVNEYAENVLQNMVLDTNWRSAAAVINFNNTFFLQLVNAFDTLLPFAASSFVSFASLYNDVAQQVSSKGAKKQGYVEHTTAEKSIVAEEEAFHKNWLISKINDILDLNYNPGDIVVLVRTRSEGRDTAKAIIEGIKEEEFHRPLKVISNESLYLESSELIRLLIHFLYYQEDNNNLIALASLVSEFTVLSQLVDFPEVNFANAGLTEELLLKYLPANFKQFAEMVQGMPLYEIIQYAIQYFDLHNRTEGKAYLDAFMDMVQDGFSDQINGVHSFLEYWEEEGRTKSVSVSEEPDAVRIMTIHKSKGLEFPFVLLPYCDWAIEPKNGTFLWGQMGSSRFPEMSVLPVQYSSTLERSVFKSMYYEEKYKSYVDNLNLLYVAFTRAELGLFTLSRQTKKGNSLGNLMMNSFEKLQGEGNLQKEEETYFQGELQEVEARPEEKVSADTKRKALKSVPFQVRASQKPAKWEESEILSNHRVKGLFWHSVLERIETVKDIPYVLNKLKREGLLGTQMINDVEQELLQLLSGDELVKTWFSGNYKVMNETDIIIPNRDTKRPDRIMIDGKRAIIVDYKTSKINASFNVQVREYMQLLSEMGYSPVEGYLWSLNTNTLLKVDG